MKIDEAWIRAHLPKEVENEPIDFFSGEYLDGLKVMHEGERSGPDIVVFQAKDEEDLRWWQLEQVCLFVGKSDHSKTWRWYRHHAENNHWTYVEHRHYDYNAIEDSRLAGFECFLRNLRYGFPRDRWEQTVQRYVGLMNRWFREPHWDYDRSALRFIEISDSREHDGHEDYQEEPRPGSIIEIVD